MVHVVRAACHVTEVTMSIKLEQGQPLCEVIDIISIYEHFRQYNFFMPGVI